MKEWINLHNIGKNFGRLKVLGGVNFALRPGEFVALLGHNGAGKSTLLRIMAGQEFSTTGHGLILGHRLGEDLAEKKSEIGLVTENINFDLHCNMNTFFHHYKKLYPAWSDELFHNLLKRADLDLHREHGTFSRGQRMQIVFLAALSTRPKLLFIDEVTSVLDMKARKFFIQLIREFCDRGGACIITSNIIHELQNSVDRMVILDQGKVCVDSSIDDQIKELSKIRLVDGCEQPPWVKKYAKWVATNADNSESYVIAKDHIPQGEDISYDRRGLTLAEIFLYYNEKEIDDDVSLLAS